MPAVSDVPIGGTFEIRRLERPPSGRRGTARSRYCPLEFLLQLNLHLYHYICNRIGSFTAIFFLATRIGPALSSYREEVLTMLQPCRYDKASSHSFFTPVPLPLTHRSRYGGIFIRERESVCVRVRAGEAGERRSSESRRRFQRTCNLIRTRWLPAVPVRYLFHALSRFRVVYVICTF